MPTEDNNLSEVREEHLERILESYEIKHSLPVPLSFDAK